MNRDDRPRPAPRRLVRPGEIAGRPAPVTGPARTGTPAAVDATAAPAATAVPAATAAPDAPAGADASAGAMAPATEATPRPAAPAAARAVPRPVAGAGRTLVAPGAIKASLAAATMPPAGAATGEPPADAALAKKRAAFDRGLSAESRAAALLLQKGFGIIGRRVRTPAGELDVIARRGDLVVFCEVKARSSLDSAAESITPRQQARLVAAAEVWLAMNPRHQNTAVRFDVVLVAPGFAPKHLPGAFDASV